MNMGEEDCSGVAARSQLTNCQRQAEIRLAMKSGGGDYAGYRDFYKCFIMLLSASPRSPITHRPRRDGDSDAPAAPPKFRTPRASIAAIAWLS
jgi:hypothetical protein